MNKKEAAAFLSCSEKTIDRLIKRGELSATFQRGKTRNVVILDNAQLAGYKAEREQPKVYMPSVVKDETAEPPPPPQSLIRQIETSPVNMDRQIETGSFSHLAEAMETLAESQKMSVLQNKPMLSLREAALFSGLSFSFLVEAAKAGSLKTFTRGERFY